MSILSVQSHVSYGYVGNRAAAFPLQSLGFDVWCVNTVNFSNHTGYGHWKGQIFSPQNVQEVIDGLFTMGIEDKCAGILSGYVGNAEIGQIIVNTTRKIKQSNSDVIYLCDPVMGDVGRGFFTPEAVVQFFKTSIEEATIITPNHFEAEVLCGHKISSYQDTLKACDFFHALGIGCVIITSLMIDETPEGHIQTLLSTPRGKRLGQTPYFSFPISPNGTGDLLSALFLGHYLRSHNEEEAFKKTLINVFAVIRQTHLQASRELAIVNTNYQEAEDKDVIFKAL